MIGGGKIYSAVSSLYEKIKDKKTWYTFTVPHKGLVDPIQAIKIDINVRASTLTFERACVERGIGENILWFFRGLL